MTILQDLQFRLEYGLLRLLVAIVRAMPLEWAAAISAWLWRTIAPWNRRHRRALENLARAYPEKSRAEHKAIARAMWANLGRVMAETMQLDRILAEPDRFEIVNDGLLHRYRGKAGPLVGVTLHTGNWELAVWPLLKWGGKPAAVYRLVKNPYVDRYLREQRKDLYPAGLIAKGRDHQGSNLAGQRAARMITQFVRDGGQLGLVCDLFDKHGLPVPFFGHPAKSTPIPAMVARRVGARLWLTRTIRIGTQSRFRIEMKELKVPRTDKPAEDIREITAAIQRQFEEWIREYPEQWMWSNRRWK